jgi:hypothetical protein
MAVASVVAGHACGSSPADPQLTPARPASQQSRIPGEYLVTLAAPARVQAITELYGRLGIKSLKEIAPNVYLMTLAEDPGPAAIEKLRAGNVHIRAVEPNLVYQTQGGGGAR